MSFSIDRFWDNLFPVVSDILGSGGESRFNFTFDPDGESVSLNAFLSVETNFEFDGSVSKTGVVRTTLKYFMAELNRIPPKGSVFRFVNKDGTTEDYRVINLESRDNQTVILNVRKI